MTPRIVISGFEPFGGDSINPTEQLVKDFSGTVAAGFEVVGIVLPVVHRHAAEKLCSVMEDLRPTAVISLGQAGGRTAVTPEKYAVNVADYPIPDNAGNQPKGVPLASDGPAAYVSTLSVHELTAALLERGLPAFVSYSAGTYVCNEVFYAVSRFREIHGFPFIHGFIHVPYIREQQLGQVNPRPWVEYGYLRDVLSAVLTYVARKGVVFL
ncbi:pyroglutamyl-peptidase I [Coprothermobacteraceae bacterium]|nr:pyroglutamyl-peptidase I [Coprothermobacteraceae bacterium]